MITFRVFVSNWSVKEDRYLSVGHIERVTEIEPTQLSGDGLRVAIRDFYNGGSVQIYMLSPQQSIDILKDCKRKFERINK